MKLYTARDFADGYIEPFDKPAFLRVDLLRIPGIPLPARRTGTLALRNINVLYCNGFTKAFSGSTVLYSADGQPISDAIDKFRKSHPNYQTRATTYPLHAIIVPNAGGVPLPDYMIYFSKNGARATLTKQQDLVLEVEHLSEQGARLHVPKSILENFIR